MAALKDKSQTYAPVGVSFATLPSRYPTLPDDVLKRFPSLSKWQEDVQRTHNRVSEAIASTGTDLSSAINQVKSTTSPLSVRVGDLSARIDEEKQARIDSDTALAATISSIVAAAGTTSTVFVQSTPPTANNVNDLWYDPSNEFLVKYWSGTAWVDATDTRLPSAVASITSEAAVRLSADNALAATISSLASTVSSNQSSTLAALASEASTRAAADTAEASTRTTAVANLQTQINTEISDRTAAVSTETAARVSGDNALASSITALTATVSGNYTTLNSAIASESSARVSGDNALATSITSLTSTVNTKNQTFYQGTAPTAVAIGDIWVDTSNGNAMKRWNGTSWVDTTIASGAISAAVSTESTARASADSALSSSITTLTATVSTVSASVTTEAAARATADGNLSGKYVLQVAAGQVVTGMEVTSSSGGGSTYSSVKFQADRFQIFNGTTGVAMFDLSGSAIRLAATLVVSTSGKVFIGAGNYGATDTAFYVDYTGQLSLKDKLKWDGSSLTITGKITGSEIEVTGSLGMHYATDSGVYTITGGVTNGVSHGAQIDLAGVSVGGGIDGYLVLSAGNSANGTILFRTGASVDRLSIAPGGLITALANLKLIGSLLDSGGNQLLTTRQSSVASPGITTVSGTGDDVGINTSLVSLKAAIDALISRLQTHGLIS